MITEDYVSFKTARLLKEKGFNVPCECFYDAENNDVSIVNGWMDISNSELEEKESVCYSAPTLQMVMKWLREKEWVICVMPLTFYCGEKASSWGYNIWAGDNLEIDNSSTPEFNTYEEACEEAIKYCLENLI